MAENSGNKQTEASVLGSLSATRPARLGRERPAPKPRPNPPTAIRPAAPKPRSKRPSATRPAPPKPAPPARDDRPSGPPSGPELVTTAVQAVGELAQIGLTVGANVLRRATSRLPRP